MGRRVKVSDIEEPVLDDRLSTIRDLVAGLARRNDDDSAAIDEVLKAIDSL